MVIQLGAKPESGFDDPLGLMSDCHRRVERFLDQLLRVTEQARGGKLTAYERAELDQALRYFRSGAPLHTRDEEESLFPRMRATGDPRVGPALDAIDALEADHQSAEKAHALADRLGTLWLEMDELADEDAAQLYETLTTLRRTYWRHIAVEDGEIFPLAGETLSAAEIAAIGREMAVRRRLDPDNLPTVNRCAQRRGER